MEYSKEEIARAVRAFSLLKKWRDEELQSKSSVPEKNEKKEISEIPKSPSETDTKPTPSPANS